MSDDQPARCDSCQAQILFVLVSNNAGHKPRLMPVNAEPDPAGNVAVLKDETGRLRGRVLVKDQRPVPPEVAYCPHFATCTNPGAHRRKRRRSGQWTAAHRRQDAIRRRPPADGILPGMPAIDLRALPP